MAFGWGKKSKPGDNALASSLENEKNKSEIILNAIADGAVLVDSRGVIQAFNPAASKITGWPASEAIGLDHHSVLTLTNEKGEPYADVDNPLTQILKDHKEIKNNTAMIKTRSNTSAALSLILSPLVTKDNIFIGAVGVFRDVTAERGEEKQRADFISTASHEMRTPVAAIEGYLALAMNDKVSHIDSKAREYLEKAHISTQHLGQLFQDLLTAAKSEDGRLTSHPVVVEVGGFIEELASDMRFAAEKKGLQMEYVIGSQSSNILDAKAEQRVLRPFYYVLVDPDRIREVMTNLFDNAVKYTEAGKITLGLTGDDNVVQIFVRDSGEGIPAEDIPHLFQKFYRVDSSITRTVGGTGLGLFICRKIVELYQGRIWVESTPGQGSTFYINLPRISSEAAMQMKSKESNQIVNPSLPTTL